MRRGFWIVVLFLSLVAVASAVQHEALVMSRNDLVKSSFIVGRISYDLHAQADVNVFNLINDINLTKGETAESIHAKIDEQRQRLYPDKEIILTITIPEPVNTGMAPLTTSLVKAIYWWNNTNSANYYWYAQYKSRVATMFIDDVKYGQYLIYDKVGSGAWVYRYTVSAGQSATRYSYGSSTLRGFKGLANGVASQADVVMYFFN